MAVNNFQFEFNWMNRRGKWNETQLSMTNNNKGDSVRKLRKQSVI